MAKRHHHTVRAIPVTATLGIAVATGTYGELAAPAQVTGLQQTGATSTSVTYSWTAAANADSYNVYVGGVFTKNVSGTSDTLSGLTALTGYSVQVAGQNAQFEGTLSTAVTMTTSATGAEGDLSVLKAFPTAEGSGAMSVGGRGGTVIYVTSLADSGAGTLREACEASGARVVIFRVAGTIVLNSQILINKPYITIAGQTAPGGGIQLSAKDPGTYPWDPNGPSKGFRQPLIAVGTHDVIIQYLRLRGGYTGEGDRGTSSGLRLATIYTSSGSREIYNVIADHLSINWWSANAISCWDSVEDANSQIRDVTFQNLLMAENVYGKRFGMNWGSTPETYSTPDADNYSGTNGTDMGDIDIHHSMLSTTFGRMPLIGLFTGNARVVNNIFYNGGAVAGVRNANPTRCCISIDYIGNRWDNGPAGAAFDRWRAIEIAVEQNDTYPPSLHINGNWGDRHGYDQQAITTLVPCAACSQVDSEGNRLYPMVPSQYLRNSPLPARHASAPITVFDVDSLDAELLGHIGASKRLDEDGVFVDNRDAVDTRIINDGYLGGLQTFLLDHEDQVGGHPTLAAGTAYTHTGDGISTAWKIRQFGTVTGYENIGSTAVPGLVGWTYLDLFLAGRDVP